tara:strand:- start:134 stop:835 length:702 start_codon:yes stop_codon:yes gene_type:complete
MSVEKKRNCIDEIFDEFVNESYLVDDSFSFQLWVEHRLYYDTLFEKFLTNKIQLSACSNCSSITKNKKRIKETSNLPKRIEKQKKQISKKIDAYAKDVDSTTMLNELRPRLEQLSQMEADLKEWEDSNRYFASDNYLKLNIGDKFDVKCVCGDLTLLVVSEIQIKQKIQNIISTKKREILASESNNEAIEIHKKNQPHLHCPICGKCGTNSRDCSRGHPDATIAGYRDTNGCA